MIPTDHLGTWPEEVKRHLQEFRPNHARELEQAGRLEAFCRGQASRAKAVLDESLDSGLSYDMAYELAGQYLFLPSEKDAPDLSAGIQPYTD